MTRTFFAAIAIGALLRAVSLPLSGMTDVPVFKVWAYGAATYGVQELYGVGGSFPNRRVLEFNGIRSKVDYPPVALYELGAVGTLYSRVNGGGFPDTRALAIALKLPGIVAEIGLLWLMFFTVRHWTGDADAGRRSALALWLNPAALLLTSVLGYVDALFVLPATAAIAAAVAGWPALAGTLIAVACLTKPQAVFVAPAVALAVWNSGPRRHPWTQVGAALAGGAMAVIVVVGPIAVHGAFWNMAAGLGSLVRDPFLSGNAYNLWWLGQQLLGWRPTAAELDGLRLVGLLFLLVAVAWAIVQARAGRDPWLISAVGAFTVHAYSMLAVSVHENHLYAAVPLLALAATGRRRFASIFLATSAILALTLNMSYGFGGDGAYAIPQTVGVLDMTAIVALASCAVFAWHAAVLRAECQTPADAWPLVTPDTVRAAQQPARA